MHSPGRQRPQLFGVLHIVQKGKHLSELVYGIGRNARCDVIQIELLQTLMDEVSYFHFGKCSP
jgi:hypothetical protein